MSNTYGLYFAKTRALAKLRKIENQTDREVRRRNPDCAMYGRLLTILRRATRGVEAATDWSTAVAAIKAAQQQIASGIEARYLALALADLQQGGGA